MRPASNSPGSSPGSETRWFLSLFCLFAVYPSDSTCQPKKTGRDLCKPVFHNDFVVPLGTTSAESVQKRSAPHQRGRPILPAERPRPLRVRTPTGTVVFSTDGMPLEDAPRFGAPPKRPNVELRRPPAPVACAMRRNAACNRGTPSSGIPERPNRDHRGSSPRPGSVPAFVPAFVPA